MPTARSSERRGFVYTLLCICQFGQLVVDPLIGEQFLFMVEEVNVRMSLYGILISLLLNLGRAKRESFQNKPGFHVMGGNIGFTDQRPLLYWGHLQGWGLRLSLRVLVLIGQLLPGW